MRKNKYHYAVDSRNRLLLKDRSKEVPVQGQFSIDDKNRLLYYLNEPDVFRKQYNLPGKIAFQGKYRLNANHDLQYDLIENNTQNKGDCLVLKSDIISASGDSFVFEVKSYDNQGLLSVYLLKLAGNWQTDESNRLEFSVQKEASPDIITLSNNWQINKNQQITYKYQKTSLKKKAKIIRTVNFVGYWDISVSDKITYILSKSSVSYFEFRAQIESRNLYPKDGVIKYRLGIGIEAPKKVEYKTISLYGTWKFGRRLGLNFDMDYGGGKIRSLEFGTDVDLSEKDRIVFGMKNKSGERLGMNIIFTHAFLKKSDAEFYLKFKGDLEKYCIESGIKIPF